MAHPQGRTAVYRFYDKTGTVIYVGISNNPAVRLTQHAADKPWWGEVVTREIEWFPARQAAECEERRLIGALGPRWNRAPGMPDPSSTVDPRKARKRPGWEPPAQMYALFARYEQEQAQTAATRDELEALIIAEMMTGVSADRMAKFLPWEAPVFRKVGKKGGVPPLRASTVVSARRPVDVPSRSV
jgi:Nuclease subunit of the excinuclease complex